jgi:hypothetical protein
MYKIVFLYLILHVYGIIFWSCYVILAQSQFIVPNKTKNSITHYQNNIVQVVNGAFLNCLHKAPPTQAQSALFNYKFPNFKCVEAHPLTSYHETWHKHYKNPFHMWVN